MTDKFISLSVIIPVYNRPTEIDELLKSLTQQVFQQFEVIVVEDGSQTKSEDIVKKYSNVLNIKYFFKTNSGPGQSRNFGCEKATGNYFVFLDSDCILPTQYTQVVQNFLLSNYTDAFGGPDAAHESFTLLQKAINYSMTSIITTGGIRGGGEKMDKFYPRSFNMGYSKGVFEKTTGFSKMRFGEDIDMSIRILQASFKTTLIKDAYVFHKRRTSLQQFFKQIYNSGIARINLYKKYPSSLKLVHLFPSAFVLGLVLLILLSVFISWKFIIPLIFFIGVIFIDSTIRNKNIIVGFLSIITCFIQFIAYGLGFIIAFWKRIILGEKSFSAFENNFYK